MKQKTLGFAALVCAAILFTESAAAAPVTYEGTLISGVAGTGTVPTGDGWITNSGDEVNFWRFFAPAGKQVDVLMRALSNALDPAFSIYAGTTTADTSLFDNAGDWDALTFIDFGATAFGGGGGQASLAFTAPQTSFYTLAVGGWDSAAIGPYPYAITVTVPEPATFALLSLGLAGIGLSRRRRSTARERA